MKTQISRPSHRPEKRYSGVYQQQGRMITDADWNELVDILKERLDGALVDVVTAGSPRVRGASVEKSGPGSPLVIHPGRLYADGIGAAVTPAASVPPGTTELAFNQQADFPGAPLPPTGGYRVYADLWERSVVSLEDAADDPHLRDPALHGADTTTRTQAMAQVKWCPAGVDPEDPGANPGRGDAPLTLGLRARREVADPCDPCADEVAVSTRTGNYLFRLEAHDVVGSPGNPNRLILKWSSENGAEQHTVGTEPSEFKEGGWIYEFYDEAAEKHLGVHLATGFIPSRGTLITDADTAGYPTSPPVGKPWVRRWDGYCELARAGSTWSLLAGRDRSVALTTGSSADADGHVDLGTKLTINLSTLVLTLELSSRTFVTGDYWQGPVRELIHDTGDTVLASALPLGITHHYLRLGSVSAGGLLAPLPTAELRRLTFPPLTDLRAGDVGYETGCSPDSATPLFDASHDTVQKALDQICQLASENIGYATDCTPAAADPLFDPALHDTVKKALDQICQLAARHIGYKTGCAPATADPLFDVSHDTVQKALDQICQLAAQNIGYQPECTPAAAKPLFDAAVHDTVKKALDQICQLAAEHIGYDGSCPSGLFDGTQKTVKEALDRLCQLAAGHVAYTPNPDCDDLAGTHTVQEAIDTLCSRPTGGSVSREILQPGHGFRVGQAICFDGDSEKYRLARADSEATTGLFLVSEVDGDAFTLLQAGYLDLAAGWAPDPVPGELLLKPGEYYFVSADEDGALVVDEPAFGLSNPILVADSDTGGYVLPWRPSQAVSTGQAAQESIDNLLAGSGQAAQEYIDNLLAGSVSAFAIAVPPEGWLECNGQAIDRQGFARLFNRIGTRFGAGNGATTFNVPDLRGEFVRGWDHGRGVDSGRDFGGFQDDQFQNHTHPSTSHTHSLVFNTGLWAGPAGIGIPAGNTAVGASELIVPATVSTPAIPQSWWPGTRAGTETRPRNVSLMYCIKY